MNTKRREHISQPICPQIALKQPYLITICLLLLLVALIGTSSGASSFATVVNGDFEAQMSGWTQTEPVAESGDAYSGVVSAKVGTGGRVYQVITLDPNTTYMLDVYVKGEGTAGVTNSSGINVVEAFDESDWTLISTTFTTGANPDPVELFGAGGSSGDVRFDDFALSPVTTSTTPTTTAPTAEPTATNGTCAAIPSQIVDEVVWDLEGEMPHPLVDDCTLRFVPLEAQHTTPNGNGWRHEYKIKSDLRVAMSETYEEFGATIKVDMSDGGKTIVAQHHASDTGTIMKLYVADSSETGFDSGANTTPGDGIFNVYVRILNESGSEEKQWLGNIESGDTFSFHVLNDFGFVEVSAFDKSFGIQVEDDSASYLKFGNYLQSQYPNGTDCGTHGDSDSFAQCYSDIGITESLITMTDVTYVRTTSTSPVVTQTPASTPEPVSCANPTAAIVSAVTESTFDATNNAVGTNIIDGDLSTRWSGQGDGAWVQLALDGSYTLEGIQIAFHQGDVRMTHFDVEVSADGSTWTSVLSGTSNGASLQLQQFIFSAADVSFIRFVGYGNSVNDWNSVTEIALCVADTTATPLSVGLESAVTNPSLPLLAIMVSAITIISLALFRRRDTVNRVPTE